MGPTRGYSTTLRAEQSSLTRERIIDTARASFLGRGYAGTTLAGVARDAGVSVQTVYNVIGGKALLLKSVYDVTLAGDDDPVPMAQRPMVRAVFDAADGREYLARYAVMSRTIGERVLPLVRMVLGQDAAGDTDVRAFAQTIEAERATGTAATARHVAERFGLRAGLDLAAAGDALWALTAPELADRLVNRRLWGWDRFQTWLGIVLADALLGPGG